MSEQELKECPLCGGANIQERERHEHPKAIVICFNCAAQVMGQTLGEARAAWNRRASPWRTDWENAPTEGFINVWGAKPSGHGEPGGLDTCGLAIRDIVSASRDTDWLRAHGYTHFMLITPPLPERKDDE